MSLRPIEVAEPDIATAIEMALLADLRQRAPQGRIESLTLSVTGSDNGLVAGLVGSTSYGWLLIKLLWVAPQLRQQGYGRALVADALARAKALQCHGAWLDTSNFEARQFYIAMGFEVFSTLRNRGAELPPGHQRWFLRRTIP